MIRLISSKEVMMKNILLTGKPGIGKTTAIKRIVEKLDSQNVNGFWSREIREKKKRIGFSIETLSGERGILAHVNQKVGPKVSRYRVNVEDIESIMIPELQRARDLGQFIIIDEIAKMEIFSRKFVDEVLRCLDTRRVIGTIQERRHPVLDRIRSREDVQLIELTLLNRDQIPNRVLELVNL
ncbi:MAG: NTPase [Candidatus Thorarchaeota archaeon]